MAKPLRSQLNQIRAWVRQGRTDAWIAHQLEVSTAELREFRRRHELNAEEEDSSEVDLRDEIEAEIEAATREEELAAAEAAEVEEEDEEGTTDEDAGAVRERERETEGEQPRRRRRRRRGGRGRRSAASMQATFDHGEEGYGLWLDPAVADDPIYAEHWAGHRPVEVSVEPDRIVIRRSGSNGSGSGSESD
ncbi:MAG TPA: hypothetical protein VK326_12140 [Solirubrobacterales bacterium]|nr:hypothetical protein [Solirubrobacterales bacterium]